MLPYQSPRNERKFMNIDLLEALRNLDGIEGSDAYGANIYDLAKSTDHHDFVEIVCDWRVASHLRRRAGHAYVLALHHSRLLNGNKWISWLKKQDNKSVNRGIEMGFTQLKGQLEEIER